MVNEFAVLMLLGAASVSLAWLLKLRNFWLLFPAGLMGVITIRALTFSAVNLFNQRNWANPVFYAILFAVVIAAAWVGKKVMYQSLWLAVSLGFASAFATRILNFTTLPDADSLWTLSVTRLFDQGSNLNKLADETSMQRGFAYPLMLSLGEPREFLTGFTPMLFAALICAAIWALTTLARIRRSGRPALFVIAILMALVSASSVMVLKTIFYINSHNLSAIAFLLSVTAIAIAMRTGEISVETRSVLSISLATASFSSQEAIVFSTLILMPLVSREWLRRRDLILLACSISVPYLVWLATYNPLFVKMTGVPPWLFVALILGVVLFVTWLIANLPRELRKHVIWATPALLVLILLVCWLVAGKQMATSFEALFQVLFTGAGDWGSLPYLICAGFGLLLLTGLKNWSEEFKSLAWSLATLILGALVLKTFATNPQGEVFIRKLAWADNLNRLLFELLTIALITLVVGFAQRRETGLLANE